MDQTSRPSPVVTVRDPARPDAAADLLAGGQEPTPVLTRRRVVAALTGAAVLLCVVGLVELRERRALEAEERRLASEVSLSLPDEDSSGGASYDGSGGELEVQVFVRNDGPRDVEVVGARLSGFGLGQDSVPLPTDRTRPLRLLQSFTCEQGRPAPLQPGPLELDVRAGSGATSTVELPLQGVPFGVDEPARLCGWVPVQEAVFVGVLEGRQSDGVLRLDLDLTNVSRSPLEVLRLLPGPGLSGRLLQAGGAAEVPLPTTLPATTDVAATRPYELELRVADCAAVQAQASATTGVEVRGQDGATAETLVDYDPELLSELLSASCP